MRARQSLYQLSHCPLLNDFGFNANASHTCTKILAEHKENQTVFTPTPTSNTPIINIFVSFFFLSLLGEHHFQAHGWVRILIPLFPLSFSPIAGRRSGNSSEFCDLQEVTSLDFSVFIHRMGTVRTDESPHGAPESHTSEVSQGCCQCSSDSWGQDWCEWLEQSGSQRGPRSVTRGGGGDRERDSDCPGPLWTSGDQPLSS